MKPNELMIGDWVMVAECVADAHFIYYPDKVESIRDGLVGLESDGLETIIERIAPIPLTAEILEKNGFSHIMYSDAYYSIMIGDTYVELRKYENMAVWFNWKENNDGVYADYILPIPEFVHELQHALRLCNIEKEIEL